MQIFGSIYFLNHFSEVIAIKYIRIVKIIPVDPGILRNINSAYVFVESKS